MNPFIPEADFNAIKQTRMVTIDYASNGSQVLGSGTIIVHNLF